MDQRDERKKASPGEVGGANLVRLPRAALDQPPVRNTTTEDSAIKEQFRAQFFAALENNTNVTRRERHSRRHEFEEIFERAFAKAMSKLHELDTKSAAPE